MIKRIFQFTCDRPSCGNTITIEAKTIGTALEVMEDNGWKGTKDIQVCDPCLKIMRESGYSV